MASALFLLSLVAGVMAAADVDVVAPTPTATPGSKLLWLSHTPMTTFQNLLRTNLIPTDDGGAMVSWKDDLERSHASYIWPCGRVVFTWNISSVNAVTSHGQLAAFVDEGKHDLVHVVNISTGEVVYTIESAANVSALTLLNSSDTSCRLLVATASYLSCVFLNGTQQWKNTDANGCAGGGYDATPCPAVPITTAAGRELILQTGPIAVDRATGATVWMHNNHEVVDFPSVGPSAVGTVVSQSYVSVYNTETGKLLWKHTDVALWPESVAVAPVTGMLVAVFFNPSVPVSNNNNNNSTVPHARTLRTSTGRLRGRNNYPQTVSGFDIAGDGSAPVWTYSTDFTVSRVGIMPFYANGTEVISGDLACFVTSENFRALSAKDGQAVGGYGPVQAYGISTAPIHSVWDHDVMYFVMAQANEVEDVYVGAIKVS